MISKQDSEKVLGRIVAGLEGGWNLEVLAVDGKFVKQEEKNG